MSHQHPRVTVVIITRNRLQQLTRALASVFAQDYPALDIVVVDDASEDGTAEYVEAQWPQITVIRMPVRSGVTVTRNLGIANARGEFIYFLDDDGWLEHDAISKCLEVIRGRPEIGAVESRLHNVINGELRDTYKPVDIGLVYIPHFVECCSLVRRTAILDAGYFADDLFWGAEGEELSLRMLYKGYRCCYQPESIMYHEQRDKRREEKWMAFKRLQNSNRIALRLWPFPWNALRVLQNILYHAPRFAFRHRYPMLPLQTVVQCCKELGMYRRKRCRFVDRELFQWYRSVSAQPVAMPSERD
ncbi:MAG: glycosyltransferase family 2 protein [Armatimonadota bacterium]